MNMQSTVHRRTAPSRCAGFELDSACQGPEGVAKVESSVQNGRPLRHGLRGHAHAPGWDGVETIERLWRVDPQMQIVICTAHSDHPWACGPRHTEYRLVPDTIFIVFIVQPAL